MKEEVTYELLVLIGARWETQAVYKGDEQHQAVADAKSLEKVSTIKAVKVVKESYDTQAQSSRQLTIFESKPKAQSEPPRKTPPAHKAGKPSGHKSSTAKASQPKAKAKGPARGAKPSGASLSEDMTSVPPPLRDGEKRPSLGMIFLQTILSLVVAVLAAFVVTQMASMSMVNTPSFGFLQRDDFLILVFIVVFAITALALITRILSKLKRFPVSLGLGASSPPRPGSAADRARLEAEREARWRAEMALRQKALQEHKVAEEKAAAEKAEKERLEQEEQAAIDAAQNEKTSDEKTSDKKPDDLLSEIIAMDAFTSDVLEVVKGDEEKRDAHVIFGVVLFLVGGVQALRTQKNLAEATYHRVMEQTLSGLGLPPDRVQHFIDHTDEYLISNPRYSKMFQSGRAAMSQTIDSGLGPRGALAEALDDWAKPKPMPDNQQPVTVLFTDIAGSTAMTQKLGDAGAQDVVRAHNTIVRDALRLFGGKEIKHTGDGIMASFSSAVSGVEAAQDMQRNVKAHNQSHPDLPLGIKIGMNAGEPISEDDDLFGTTVQLAARIVDKAQSGQILVSSSVHGLSQGKNLKLERFDDFEMKGFDDPVTVYAAPWDLDAPAANANATVQPAAQPDPKPESQPAPTKPDDAAKA